MPRAKTYSLVTILRRGDDIDSVDVADNLSVDQLITRLSTPVPGGLDCERRVFSGNEIEWSPSVRLGGPAKRKAKPDEKKPRKPREEKPNGTRFEPDGAKSAKQGETHGA